MIFLWLILGVFVVFVVLGLFTSARRGADRRSGLVPPAGHATMADVERLVRADRRIDAIRCYREIHQCGLAEAKKAVEDLHVGN